MDYRMSHQLTPFHMAEETSTEKHVYKMTTCNIVPMLISLWNTVQVNKLAFETTPQKHQETKYYRV